MTLGLCSQGVGNLHIFIARHRLLTVRNLVGFRRCENATFPKSRVAACRREVHAGAYESLNTSAQSDFLICLLDIKSKGKIRTW